MHTGPDLLRETAPPVHFSVLTSSYRNTVRLRIHRGSDGKVSGPHRTKSAEQEEGLDIFARAGAKRKRFQYTSKEHT